MVDTIGIITRLGRALVPDSTGLAVSIGSDGRYYAAWLRGGSILRFEEDSAPTYEGAIARLAASMIMAAWEHRIAWEMGDETQRSAAKQIVGALEDIADDMERKAA